MPSSVPYSPVARGSEAVAKQTALSIATTVPTAQCFIVTATGEVEGPGTAARQAPPAHTVFQRWRRATTHASRPPPTIVRRRPARRLTIVGGGREDRKSTRLNSSHSQISYAVFCLKKKTNSPR